MHPEGAAWNETQFVFYTPLPFPWLVTFSTKTCVACISYLTFTSNSLYWQLSIHFCRGNAGNAKNFSNSQYSHCHTWKPEPLVWAITDWIMITVGDKGGRSKQQGTESHVVTCLRALSTTMFYHGFQQETQVDLLAWESWMSEKQPGNWLQ